MIDWPAPRSFVLIKQNDTEQQVISIQKYNKRIDHQNNRQIARLRTAINRTSLLIGKSRLHCLYPLQLKTTLTYIHFLFDLILSNLRRFFTLSRIPSELNKQKKTQAVNIFDEEQWKLRLFHSMYSSSAPSALPLSLRWTSALVVRKGLAKSSSYLRQWVLHDIFFLLIEVIVSLKPYFYCRHLTLNHLTLVSDLYYA